MSRSMAAFSGTRGPSGRLLDAEPGGPGRTTSLRLQDAGAANRCDAVAVERTVQPPLIVDPAVWSIADRRPAAGRLEAFSVLQRPDDPLLWMALRNPSAQTLRTVRDRLGLPGRVLEFLSHTEKSPCLRSFRNCYGVRLSEVTLDEDLRVRTGSVVLLCAPNLLVTVVTGEGAALVQNSEVLRRQDAAQVRSAEHIALTLLCALLDGYATAAAVLRAATQTSVDRAPPTHMDAVNSRVGAATAVIQRCLEAHCEVFSGLADPQFRPSQSESLRERRTALFARFKRELQSTQWSANTTVAMVRSRFARAQAGHPTRYKLMSLQLALVLMALTSAAMVIAASTEPMAGEAFAGWLVVSAMTLLVAVTSPSRRRLARNLPHL